MLSFKTLVLLGSKYWQEVWVEERNNGSIWWSSSRKQLYTTCGSLWEQIPSSVKETTSKYHQSSISWIEKGAVQIVGIFLPIMFFFKSKALSIISVSTSFVCEFLSNPIPVYYFCAESAEVLQSFPHILHFSVVKLCIALMWLLN